MLKFRSVTLFHFTLFIVIFSVTTPAQISKDAIELTLRAQEGIFLDSLLAKHIDSCVTVARLTNDTLNSIHAFPTYVVNELIISTSASWSDAWRRSELWTGDNYIDSLGKYYGLIGIEKLGATSNFFILKFNTPLNIKKLCLLYNNRSGVNFTEPNQYCCDGNNIEYFRKNGVDHFAFSYGSGDCPAGCIYRYYWYVTVSGSGLTRKAELEESRSRSGAKIYRWNIPNRYAMTMFPSLDSILAAIQFSPDWWVRKHAIEGVRRFFERNSPWVGEDLNKRWDTLKLQAQSRKSEILAGLDVAKNDADPDVKASAEFASNRLKTVGVNADIVPAKDFVLLQNYPNPFNSSTQIQFMIARESEVTLSIFNILGQEVSVLVNSVLTAGSHSVSWNGERFPSGIYYYTLRTGSYSESKKMLLLK